VDCASIGHYANIASDTGAEFYVDAFGEGVRQCHRFGVTSVGDITGRFCHAVRRSAAARTIRLTSFGEVTAMAARRAHLEPRISQAVDADGVDAMVRLGISPHAPYSIEGRDIAGALRWHYRRIATGDASGGDAA